MEFLSATFSSILGFVVLLGVVIFVHEAGHLLVAKAFGVRVLTFSLGFGKRLWGFTRKGTDYRVSLVPLGGYVKMSGELAGEETEDPSDFLNKPRWQRFLVYLAGPAMNGILSVALIALLFTIGLEVPALQDIPARVGAVQPGSSAESAGLLPGDLIVEVDGEAVQQWDKVQLLLMTAQGRPVTVEILRGTETLTREVTPAPIPEIHLFDTAGILPEQLLTITEVAAGMPAQAAGLRAGDRLLLLDAQPVVSFEKFVEHVSARAGQPIQLVIARDGRELAFTLTPKDVGGAGKIGIGAGFFQKYGPVQAVVQSVRYNGQILSQTFFVLGKIFTGRIAAESALSGPIEIAKFAGQAARSGPRYYLHLMAVISISIGFLNLLPIPVLDGGQMLLLAIEGVMRRDLSLRIKEIVNQLGFAMILLIMLAVIYFDLKKSLPAGLLPGE